MNDSEIIKALECCTTTKGGCKECPMKGYEKVDCQLITATEAYKLINRQQTEIDTMKDTMAKLLNTLERANKYGLGADKRIEQLKIELKKAKSEAVREFAERLKEYCNEIANQEWNKRTLPVSWADAYKDFIDDIDRLLEEMGCDDE